MTYSLYFNLLSLHCAYRYCVPAGDLFVLMFYRSIMRDVTARQGRAPALQGYLYTHSCEIFRLRETGKERNPPTPAGISHGEAIFHLRSKFHKSRKGFISFIIRLATDGRPYGVT